MTTNRDKNSRPLPKVSETFPASRPPYNNVTNQHGAASMPSNSKLASNERPVYMDIPELQQRRPEPGAYSQLSVVDHYEMLAPAESSRVKSTPQTPQKVVTKKCVCLAVGCILFCLVVVLASSLATLFVLRNNLDKNLNTKFSSLVNFQSAIKMELIQSIQSLCSNYNETTDLTILYSDTCYCLYRKQLTWDSAREFCLSKGPGVHLAEIYDKKTNDFLIPILQASQTNTGIWLGGSDLVKEGVWLWNYTKIPIETFNPTQWALNEPSNFRFRFTLEEHCLEVFNHTAPIFMWNDHSCTKDNVKPFLCQSPKIGSRCFC
ncbi:asialoglycoprotein receptor 2-like [Biomphalaria glabrata]|uniref:Asialoglycoprotein receptor 2-like n=1 Tax=Biomphalaria glabrata TaxID=6526 RepID=A0A9W3A8U6_BIOGL|nr:asialoglycoprotein receptor 2-like [Biomphalaria glabrata]